MQACRYALEVVAKHPIYLLVYVGFLSLMGLFITSGVYPPATSAGYESAEVPFAVIDRDQSDLSRSVAAFLEERGTSVEVADEARACQDAVATGLVDYLLIVPAGFEEGYLAAARDGGDGPRLETVFSFQSMAATLVDTQVNQYLGLVRAAAVLEPDASPEALVAQAEASAQKEPRIEEVSVPGAAVGSEAFVFYLMWSAYPLTVAVVVSAGILMGAFNRTDVRRRVAVSSTSGLGLGLQKAAAGLVVALRVGRYHGHRPCRIRLFRIHPRTGRSCLRAGGGARVRAHPAGHRVSAGAAGLRRVCRTPWATSPAWC
ncbi:MAG: ABC transporter permease [Adlercreutzia equolifaciens]